MSVKITEADWRPFEQEIGYGVRDFGAVVPRKGVWIRGHLLEVKHDWVWNMFRLYRAFARSVPFHSGQYSTFRNYQYVCRLLGLIEEDHREPSPEVDMRQNERVFYRLVKDQLHDPAWENPYRAYRLLIAERGFVARPKPEITKKAEEIVIRKGKKEVRVRV